MIKKSEGRGAAEGLNLDNLEDMVVGLRRASEPIRVAKMLRDTERYEKQREERKKPAKRK